MNNVVITAVGATQISMERHFAAPVARVVQAWLEPDLITRWLGSPEMPMVLAEMDARPGGGFRLGWDMPTGQQLRLSGTFVQMDVAENGDRCIVHTEVFDPDMTGGEALERVDYLAQDGGTLVRSLITYGTQQVRDAALDGMADGMRASYARLDAVLAA